MSADSYTEWDGGYRRWDPVAGWHDGQPPGWDDWRPFGLTRDDFPPPDDDGRRVVNVTPAARRKEPKDRAGLWLRNAMIALGLLALAAAVVSYAAQYHMVYAAKGVKVVAALEAGIPDVSAVVFASLGIALALHGKRALRARALNVASVATSIGMNALAAGHGWRNAAIWVMPPVAYALASDTAIGVIRAYTIARQRQLRADLADDEATPLAIAGGIVLWLLRLCLAPLSTCKGFRRWVVETCPVAPGRRALTQGARPELTTGTSHRAAGRASGRTRSRGTRAESKTARFLALVREHHGDLAGIDPARVSRICSELAPQVDLNVGSARSALLPLVRAARTGDEA
jgi:Protein of unknown function (DUF2637)